MSLRTKIFPDSIFIRDIEHERSMGIQDIKLFGYQRWSYGDVTYQFFGEIVAEKLRKNIRVEATFLDKDGDIIGVARNYGYGEGNLSVDKIYKAVFFNRYPFRIYVFDDIGEISKIKIDIF